MLITVMYEECGSGITYENTYHGGFHQHRGAPQSSMYDAAGTKPNAKEGQHFNAYQFHHPSSAVPSPPRVTLADLVGAFPLGRCYHFDIQRRDGVFESAHALDLSSPVPVTADGVVTCRVFKLAHPPRYASGGTGRRLEEIGSNPSDFAQGNRGSHARRGSGGAGGGGHHHGKMVKDLTKNAGKATKGLLGFVGHAVQRAAEYVTQQELTIGVYKVQIVREMAEGGEHM